MILNGSKIILSEVIVENVNCTLIIHDRVSKKIILLNEISSFIWKLLVEFNYTGNELTTHYIVQRILDVCGMKEDNMQEVLHDVEEIISKFFNSKLISNFSD